MASPWAWRQVRSPSKGLPRKDDSDFFTWRVVFEGPADSLPGAHSAQGELRKGSETRYEGGIFTTILRFPGDFPNNPPEMRFETEMWHPNIYPDGRVGAFSASLKQLPE